MGKQKMTPIGIACILLVLLVVAFMVRGSLREPEKIVLPPEPSTTEPSGPTVDNEAVDRVEVRPDTVQSAIEVLARPRVYTRTITVERYWSGGLHLVRQQPKGLFRRLRAHAGRGAGNIDL